MTKKNITLIVAMDDNGGIGKDNKLPWHIPEDLKHFRDATQGSIVVMGRKTYESLKAPLRERLNVVLTNNTDFIDNRVKIFYNSDELRDFIIQSEEPVSIIGGKEIYNLYSDICDIMYITHVTGNYDADTFFDKRNLEGFALSWKTPLRESTIHTYKIAKYRRK